MALPKRGSATIITLGYNYYVLVHFNLMKYFYPGYRYCNSSGMWHSGTFSNYSECVDLSMLPPTIPTISDVPTTPGYVSRAYL